MLLMKGDGRLARSCRALRPILHGPPPGERMSTTAGPGIQACVEESANQFCFLQKEAFQYAYLVSSRFGPNADFIFAFYELERGNSFPWYNMSLWSNLVQIYFAHRFCPGRGAILK